MRDLFVFLVVMLLLPTSYRRPFVGLLLFSWLAYMRPQDLCWGFARTMRLSFFVGIAMTAGWYAFEKGRRPFVVWDFRSRAIVALGLLIAASYAFAPVHDEYTNRYFVEFLKILVVALFTTGQVDSPQRFRALAWTIALSLAFFGVKNGLGSLAKGGAPILRGPGGMLEDNNDFALALVMNVPLLWYLGIDDGRQWVKRATQVAVALTALTVLLLHSRGGFLAMVASALWIAWRSGKLVRAGMFLATLAVIFPVVVPTHVLERLMSIGDTQDSSRNARLTAWATAFRMIEANPVFGVGMRNFQTSYRDYSVVPLGETGTTYVAHNSYLQVWAESGTPAFLVYLMLLGSVFLLCRKVFRVGRARPELGWAKNWSRMMEATTVGFMVGAFFLNRGHFDLVYHWLSLVTALGAVTMAAVRAAPGAAAPEQRGVISVRWRPVYARGSGVALPVWRRPS